MARLHRLLPVFAFAGTLLSALLFIVDLPSHADRGSWGDLWATGRYHVWPVLLLTAVSFFVRGRTIFGIAAAWFGGYFLSIGVTFLILDPTGSWLGEDSRWQTAVLVPVFEELSKALPLLLVYLGARRATWNKMTVTDFTILGLAAGGGFAFHEDALLARVISSGWDGWWGMAFPAVVQEPIFAAGHGVWTGLVGLGFGLALARRGRSLSWLPLLIALAVAMVDHGLINDDGGRALLLDGRLPVYLLAAGIVTSLVVETRAIASAPEGGIRFREWISSEIAGVRTAKGIRGKFAEWQDFMLWLRLNARIAWFGRTEFAGAGDASPQAPTDGGGARGRLVRAAVVAVAAVALVWWLSQDDADDEQAEDPIEETEGDATEEHPDPEDEAPGDTTTTMRAPGDFGDGPNLASAVYLRWTNEDERGPKPDTVLVVDGDRELRTDSGLLQYRDGDTGLLCFGDEFESMTCVVEPPADRLTALHYLGPIEVPDLPGVETESRTIAGRETFCVLAPIPGEDDSYVSTCTDTESGLVLALESRTKLLTGDEVFTSQELVEWSTPSDDHWELPPAAEELLAG